MPEIVAAKVKYVVSKSFMVNDYPKPKQVTIFNIGNEVTDKDILDRFKNYITRELVEAKGVKIKIVKAQEEPKAPEPGAKDETETEKPTTPKKPKKKTRKKKTGKKQQ